MKITLLVNKDIASCIALNRLVPALVEHQLTIGLSAFVGNVENLHPGLQTLKFFEQDLFNKYTKLWYENNLDDTTKSDDEINNEALRLLKYEVLGFNLIKEKIKDSIIEIIRK